MSAFYQTRFGTRNGAVNYKSRTPIDVDELRVIAPSIFADDKHTSRSDRYTHIPTTELLSSLSRNGFHPYSVKQGGSRDDSKRGFTKHQLRLRHESQQLTTVGDSFAEIVLLNSHDGTSSYQLGAGMFRLVCLNGLTVAETVIASQRFTHVSADIPSIVAGCESMLESLPTAERSVHDMGTMRLTSGEQLAIASAALAFRYSDADTPAPFAATQLLSPRRAADTASDLWTTTNVIQENLIRGGLSYVHTSDSGERTRRSTRPVNGIDQDTAINRALWTLAEEMRKLKI